MKDARRVKTPAVKSDGKSQLKEKIPV
jgi:hypothetical protein